MKKFLAVLLVLTVLSGAVAAKEVPETSLVRWNSGASGNVLLTIAEKLGYFEEVGIKLQEVPATANASAMTLLSTGMVDVVSNAGTSNPLQQIAAGVDLTIFGGHMMTGAMPIIAKKGVKWNGVKDLVGKKFACNPSYFALTGAVMDLGYEKPLEALDWVVITNYNDALAAVIKGEVDYALQGTEQNYTIKNVNKDNVEIMCYMSDIMPAYSCCRMEAKTEFVKNNPITIKLILKALLRAQSYYEAHKAEAAAWHAEKIRADKEFVEAYMFDEHYRVNADPLLKSIIRAWNILDATGFLSETAKSINIRDHVNTELYREALKEAAEEYGKEAPEFYEKMQKFFEENNNI
ncbi:MAG: ABC transporter substrate-binding protein [Synergistaceae bacterium]|nr:ABC transporter substrate-binding protein [Synergistaceae bacterium]MBR1658584.1 ABC transporter substrate-binding protein [Synergistaceae bacterium]